jgi:hypothetical protein
MHGVSASGQSPEMLRFCNIARVFDPEDKVGDIPPESRHKRTRL